MEFPDLVWVPDGNRQKLLVRRSSAHPISWVLPHRLQLPFCLTGIEMSVRCRYTFLLCERATMINLRRTILAIASVSIAISLSGCCVTSISSRKSCQTPASNYQPTYEPIPQGIGPAEIMPPAAPPPPAPVPPAPSPTSTMRNFGTRTTQLMQSWGDSMRDTFTRS